MTGRARPGAPGIGSREPALRAAVRLRRLSRWQAEGLREELADLYMESASGATGRTYRDRADFLRRLAADARRPGFALLLAETTTLAGCAFGVPLSPDGSWWRGFHGPLPPGYGQLTAAGQVFAITELVIHSPEQHRAVAHRLQERLLTDAHASLAVTVTHPADRTARTAFRSWGWQEIGQLTRPSDPAPGQCVLALPLDATPADAT